MAGVHNPVIPFEDEAGNVLIIAPLQNGPTWVKAGVIFGFMVMVIVLVVAHCPVTGVNVYVVVTVLFMIGVQVPIIPLIEVSGNETIAVPAQNGPT